MQWDVMTRKGKIMIVDTWKDPYNAGFSPTTPRRIEVKRGFTVLVGCNGAGKSTLIANIEAHCKKNNIPCYKYDNLKDGGANSVRTLMFERNYADGVKALSSSEGENIRDNICRICCEITDFIKQGYIYNKTLNIKQLFAEQDEIKKQEEMLKNCKERVILFDAVDSGLSVDSIAEMKSEFINILDCEGLRNPEKDIYLIITANEYELAAHSNCLDVNTGKYISFTDYEDACSLHNL